MDKSLISSTTFLKIIYVMKHSIVFMLYQLIVNKNKWRQDRNK